MATAVLPDMTPMTFDTEQTALVKLVYWLQSAAEASGATDITTMLQPSMAANANDARQPLLVKAAYWAKQIADNGGGTGGGLTFTAAAGEPPVDGSITTQGYHDTTADIYYLNTAWPTTATPAWKQI